MSRIIIASFANILVVFLPMIGLQIGTDELTVTIQTIVVIVSSFYVWVRRVNMGGVGIFGGRTN